MINSTKLLVVLVAVAFATVGVRAEKFSAGGISFEGPKGWLSQKPSSSMRKAQFVVKGKDGKTAEVCRKRREWVVQNYSDMFLKVHYFLAALIFSRA